MFMRMIYDDHLAAAAYLLGCQRTGEAIVVDPERDVDRYIDAAKREGLRIVGVAETHIHADFLSGSRELAERAGATVYLSGEGGRDWSYQWLDKKSGGGAYPHRLLRDEDAFSIGAIEFKALHTPGHTPEHLAFLVTDRGSGATEPMGLLSGDCLFVGDVGRPDLLESAAGQAGAAEASARELFQTVKKLETIPDFLQVWPAHGAGSACGKALGAVPSSTIGYEKRFNPALRAATGEQAFTSFILEGQPEPPLYFARMKRQNRDGPALLERVPQPRELAASEVLALDTSRVALIDTRSWDAFRSGHVRGALFHPYNKSFVTDVGSMVAEHEDIVLIIGSMRDAAVRDLVRIGLDRVVGWASPDVVEECRKMGAPLATTEEINITEARRRMREAGDFYLDVRRASEFAAGHAPGATNHAHTRLAAAVESLPKDKRLVVGCLAGGRSARASAFLERRGFKVANLSGGFSAWEKSGAPVER